MKVFPNKDDSLASGLRVKQTRLLSPSSNPSPSAWWTWQMQTGSLSQMETHEFTHDFMWKHTDFKWCRRQSHRGEICLPLSSQVLLQLKSHIFHIYIIIFSPKVSSLDKCMPKLNLEKQIMTQTIQWKIKDSIHSVQWHCNLDVCYTALIQKMSLLSASQLEPRPGVLEGAEKLGHMPRPPWALADAPWQIEAATMCSHLCTVCA